MKMDDLRQGIDNVDDKILELLNERAGYVKAIGHLKQGKRSEFYVPTREQAIFDRLNQKNTGPFPPEAVFKVFREIISASLALEYPLKAAYLGPPATFTHQAALKQFGRSARLVGEKSIAAVFAEVETGRADYGVVPVENSNEGAVTRTLDMFTDSNLKIIAENYLEVTHSLLSLDGEKGAIERIYSHPQALEQCKRWLADNCPGIPLFEVSSTARAAQVAHEERGAAAIAGLPAGELYDLKTVAGGIEDNHDNHTRFLIIGKSVPKPTGRDKTSILFSFDDGPGVLARMLEPFGKHGINLSKIESRPIRKKAWAYVFFVDLVGHIDDQPVAAALEDLKSFCTRVKHLGSYPNAR